MNTRAGTRHRWFVGSEGIRSGWRVLIHSLLMSGFVACTTGVLLLGVVLWMMSPAAEWKLTPWMVGWLAGLAYMTIVLVMAIVTIGSGRLLDTQGGARTVGLGGPIGLSLRQLLEGVIWGALALAPALLIMGLGADFDVQISAFSVSGIANWLGISFLLVWAATAEELIFRGYAFAWLCRGSVNVGRGLAAAMGWTGKVADAMSVHLGRALPVAGVALLFGIVHVGNPGHTWIATLNTALAAVWLSVAFFRSGALWLPVGLHFGWNWTQGLLLGMPVSGAGSEEQSLAFSSPLRVVFEGSDWIAGGTYGVEGSIGCSVALLAATVLMAVGPVREPSARHQSLVLPDKSASLVPRE